MDKIMAAAVTLACVLFAQESYAYDVKHYAGFAAGVSRLDHSVPGNFHNDGSATGSWEQKDDTSASRGFFVGSDLAARWAIEFRLADLGDYEFEAIDQAFSASESVSVNSYSLSVLFYAWGSRALDGLSARRGLNLYVGVGVSQLDDGNIFANFTDLEGYYANVGIGLEYAFSTALFVRSHISAIESTFLSGTVAVGWRWGRDG